ncbi:serine protease [Actinacidiphila bryophytorum]|uniref:serine protease n=1 Tax=Actinacidiphila bryophytorum TaxID=1436133 RepID=UPI002176B6C8|nr:serine protease [Actinacidiphila bryophytorum]UWE09350.1 serine protease [Actinacidiphila bryophytorum]
MSRRVREGAGLEMARVAEVIVRRADSAAGRRGSGYRVADRYVLTAAHLVNPPLSSVSVRFEADRSAEWSTDARVVLRSAPADLALLELVAPPSGVPAVHRTPRYAVVSEADVTLSVTAVGFPRFKLRADLGLAHRPGDGSPSQYRDSCHVDGTVSVLSNRRAGTFEVAVPPPADEMAPGRSPWEGMSGAALWCEGALIGLISAHHRSDGPGRLAAVRVERWYEQLVPTEIDLLHTCAGLPLAPTTRLPPAMLPARPSMAELSELVDAMGALPTLRRADGLEAVLDDVDPRISAHRPRDSSRRVEIYGLLRTCLRYTDAFDQLMTSLRTWEQDSHEMRQVENALHRLTAGGG